MSFPLDPINRAFPVSPISKHEHPEKSDGIVAKQDYIIGNNIRLTITHEFAKNASESQIASKMREIAQRLSSLGKKVASLPVDQPVSLETCQAHIRATQSPQEEVDTYDEILRMIFHTEAGHSVTLSREILTYDPQQMQHLYLSETPRLFKGFMKKLAEKHPDCKQAIEQLEEKGLSILRDTYKEDYYAWNDLRPIYKEEAKLRWGSKDEVKRQKSASKALLGIMYEALDLPHESRDEDTLKQIAKDHKDIFMELAKERKEEISNEGKIDYGFSFKVPTEDPNKTLTINIHTRQFGEEILSSLDVRDGKKPGLVNSHIEQVTFSSPDHSRIFSSSKLRTGSFDFADKPIDETALMAFCEKLNSITHQSEFEVLTMDNSYPKKTINDMRARLAANEDETIEAIWLKDTYKDFLALAVIAKEKELATSDQPKKAVFYQELLQKAIVEAQSLYKDEIIMSLNTDKIETMLESEEAKSLGMNIPSSVKEVFKKSDNSILNGSTKGWGMISLQTPVNILSGIGINKFILKWAQSPYLPKFIRKALENLTDKDISELISIEREMKAYKQAEINHNNKEESDAVKCLYFNIPTNVFGKKRAIFTFGPFSKRMRLSTIFDRGVRDKSYLKDIRGTTYDSLKTVYDTAQAASKAIEDKQEALMLENQEKTEEYKTLERYKTTLKDLMEQTFDESMKLRMEPNDHARYESVGRLTVLMEILNMKTTGHCRSGNNRTAAWLAKSNQILGSIAASDDGKVPSPSETASYYDAKAEKKKEHWTLPIFAGTFQSSLTLQMANKGIRGTKEKLEEFVGEGLRTATVGGGFGIAGRFDQKLLPKRQNE